LAVREIDNIGERAADVDAENGGQVFDEIPPDRLVA
jgi:hypothetical protein